MKLLIHSAGQYAAVLFVALTLAACSNVDTARWTEEVKSFDGRVFVLEGYAERDRTGYPLEHRGPVRFIEYYHKDSGAYWKQTFGYHPAVFDVLDGSPIVLVTVETDGQCYQHGFPPLGLIGFRWVDGAWEQFVPDGLPVDKMTFNVLRRIFDRKDAAKDAQGFLSLSEKSKRDPGEIRLGRWIEEWGKRCATAKQQGLQVDAPPPPTLVGSHGNPKRFAK